MNKQTIAKAGKLNAYLDEHPEQLANYRFKEDEYLASLLAKGLLMEVEYGTLHLTEYSCYKKFRFTADQRK